MTTHDRARGVFRGLSAAGGAGTNRLERRRVERAGARSLPTARKSVRVAVARHGGTAGRDAAPFIFALPRCPASDVVLTGLVLDRDGATGEMLAATRE
jgi:hypothetical protein